MIDPAPVRNGLITRAIYKYSGTVDRPVFSLCFPSTTIITPTVVKTRKVIWLIVILSFSNVNAKTVQQIGERLLTTPMTDIGICLAQALFIKLPTEP